MTPLGGWVGMEWVTAWKDKVSPRSEAAYGKKGAEGKMKKDV